MHVLSRFNWFHVQGDVCVVAETLFEFLLNLTGEVVRIKKRQVAIHANVCLDSDAVANATSAQIVRLANLGERGDDVFYFLLSVLRQRALGELANAFSQQFHCHFHEE